MYSQLGLSDNLPADFLAKQTPETGQKIANIYKIFNEYCNSELSSNSPTFLERSLEIEKEILGYVTSGKLIEVPDLKREMFSASCAIKACWAMHCKEPGWAEEALRALDLALLVGLPIKGWDIFSGVSDFHDLLLKNDYKPEPDNRILIDTVWRMPPVVADEERGINHSSSSDTDSDSESESESEDDFYEPDEYNDEVITEDEPSVEMFYSQFFEQNRVVKLVNCMSGWAACTKWKYVGYLKRVAGHRLVPVEMGDYSRGGTVRLIKLGDYLDEIMEGKSVKEIGYMAQHHLLHQEPRLRQDVLVPDYCAVSDIDEPMINCWLGPSRTFSPLHYDPQPNILAQVIGRKNVFIYAPENQEVLYPRKDRLFNTSQVNMKHINFEQFPLFGTVEPLRVTVHPGEMLFIPAGWWHAVAAIDTSFSVNFFF